MSELFTSPFFGLTLSVLAYSTGMRINRRFSWANTLIVAAGLVILVLTVLGIPYEDYNVGGTMMNFMVTPATVCLAVGIYDKLPLLKKNLVPVLAGCVVGMIVCVGSILILCRLFGMDAAFTAGMLPKSVTMPIATAVAEAHNGQVAITVAAVIVTGALGNIFAPFLYRWLPKDDPLALGLAIGACSHAMGTAKAMELDKTVGAMSGLSIGLCGIVMSILALGFGLLL